MSLSTVLSHVTFVNARTAKTNLDDAYVFKNLLHTGEVSLFYGDSNVGKSFFAIEAARRTCEGQAIGPHASKIGSVIYAATEASSSIVNRARFNDLPDNGGQFLVSGCALNLTCLDSVKVWIEAVRREQKTLEIPPNLFVIDTLSLALHGADENNASVMANAISNAKRIAEELSVHAALIHHEGKDTSRGGRGSSAIRGSVDTILHLIRGEDDAVVVTCEKQRNRPRFQPFAFKITSVPLPESVADTGGPTTVARAEFVDFGEQAATAPAKAGYAQRKSAIEGFYCALEQAGVSPDTISDEDIANKLPPYLFEGCQEKTRIKRIQELRRELRKQCARGVSV